MRVLIDTNVLISAALNPNSVPFQAYVKAASFFNVKTIKNQKQNRVFKVFEGLPF